MKKPRIKTKRLGPIFFLVLLVFLISTTIILHDYFCHEHLHELSSPLHSYYNNPEPFEARTLFGSPPPEIFLSILNEKIHLCEYIKNIFHPPDFLA